MSKLFMHEELQSSVRYRSSCLRPEDKSFSYATWHSVVRKTNEVWHFGSLRFRYFVALRLFADCIIFSSEGFSPGPYYLWNLINNLSLQ